jgi:chaperonin GroES
MKIKPLRDRVLIKRVESEEKTSGGIIIPDSAQEKSTIGVVVEVGSGKVLEDGKVLPNDVKKGDRVVFPKYSGSEIDVKGEQFLLMSEDEIMGVLDSAESEDKPKKKK